MEIVVSEHLSASLPERLAAHQRGDTLLIADTNTHAALGDITCKRIAEATGAKLHLLKNPEASLSQAEDLHAQLKDVRFAIAIGSGTINDLVKYAATHADIDYAIVATAPSMNGYSSATASLCKDGFKQSFPCVEPAAIYADVTLLSRSPARMRAAGMGDTLCRATVQTDWRLAHVLTGEDYNDNYFEALLPLEQELLANAERIAQGDTGIMQILFKALLAGGDAMRRHGSSMPASQGEHMIAHTMEYLGHHGDALHGEEVAITSLTMAQLQKRILKQDAIRIASASMSDARLPSSLQASFAKKHEALQQAAIESWAEKKEWIAESSIDPQILEQALQKAGCPLRPQDIGWDEKLYTDAVALARYTRDRITFLDIEA